MRRAIVLLMLASCGTGAARGGPPANAPFSGAAGYAKVNGTYIIVDSLDLTDPDIVGESAHGPLAIWMTRDGTEIWRADLARIGTDASPLRVALTATESWEMGEVAAPSVERDAGGYHMAYQAAGSVIALADSADGEHWTGKRMIGPGHAPSLVRGFVFYEQQGEIWRAPNGTKPAFHILTGTNPDVRVRTTPGDREIWQMFFNCIGRDRVSAAICYAGSFDAEDFVTTYAPILQPDLPDESGPSALVSEDFAVLLFAQAPSGLRSRIGAATAP